MNHNDDSNLFYVFSSRFKEQLYESSNDRIGIFSENGLWVKYSGNKDNRWQRSIDAPGNSISNFSEQILNILQYYSKRVPNSSINISEVNSFMI